LRAHGIDARGVDPLKTMPRGVPREHPLVGLLRYGGLVAKAVWPVAPWVSIRAARYLTRVHDRLLRTGLAQLTDPSPPAPAALRAADRTYQAAIDELIRGAGLAA
jgi:hypothetical protein